VIQATKEFLEARCASDIGSARANNRERSSALANANVSL
jgi:hypothetical protein